MGYGPGASRPSRAAALLGLAAPGLSCGSATNRVVGCRRRACDTARAEKQGGGSVGLCDEISNKSNAPLEEIPLYKDQADHYAVWFVVT